LGNDEKNTWLRRHVERIVAALAIFAVGDLVANRIEFAVMREQQRQAERERDRMHEDIDQLQRRVFDHG